MTIVPDRPVIGDVSVRMTRDPYTTDLTFIDLETTGLTAYDLRRSGEIRQYNEVIELAAIRVTQPALEVVSEWTAKFRPRRIETAHPKALQVNGYSATAWSSALPLEPAVAQFLELTRDTIIVSHNMPFDSEFLVALLKEAGAIGPTDSTPWYNNICTLSGAFFMLHGLTPRLRGALVAETLGIAPEPEVHGALNGARQCYQIYCRLRHMADDPIIRARTEELIHRFWRVPV